MSPRVGDSPSSAIHVSDRASVNLKEPTPLNGKDLSTGTGSSSDRVGGVDLSESRRDSKGEGSGFGDE